MKNCNREFYDLNCRYLQRANIAEVSDYKALWKRKAGILSIGAAAKKKQGAWGLGCSASRFDDVTYIWVGYSIQPSASTLRHRGAEYISFRKFTLDCRSVWFISGHLTDSSEPDFLPLHLPRNPFSRSQATLKKINKWRMRDIPIMI